MHRLLQTAKEILESALSWLFLLLVIVVFAAKCAGPLITGQGKDSGLQIVEADMTNPTHKKIASALERVWSVSSSGAETNMKLFIANSPDINAASFGNGRFLFWAGTAELPEDLLEAISAHEVAHDMLKHSRNAGELRDLTDFFGEAVSFITGSDDPTEQTLKDWFGKTVIPRYSRAQELEADIKAVALLGLVGTENPKKAMSACLETLLSKYGNSGGRFFDSHPSTKERIERLNAPGPEGQ
jgi:Zn-dependent protease with chaperone function